MTWLAEALFKDGSLYAGEKLPREDLVVGDSVLPTDVKDFSELYLLKPLQTFDVLTIQTPGLTIIQNGGEYHSLEGQKNG